MANTLNGNELFITNLPTWLDQNIAKLKQDIQLLENALTAMKKEEDVTRLKLSKARLALHHCNEIWKGLEQPNQICFSADTQHKGPVS